MKLRLLGAAAALACALTALPAAGAVEPHAAAAVLMDAGSGRVLYEEHAHEPRPIASITKLMTALVALESGRALDETVTILPQWTGAEGSSLYLRPGETLTLEDLLYGLLLRSGNDAALAVAGYCAGSEEAFVAQMNRRAGELGMKDTHFTNPSGLDGEGHVSSAYDMALLARACLDNETLREIASTRSVSRAGRVLTNHNKLLWRYEGCIGLKTGYTQRAGRTLVSAAEREGLTLICVTLNDPDDWADHAALLDWGFDQYRAEPVVRAGERVGSVPLAGSLLPACPVAAGETLTAALADGEAVEVRAVWKESPLTAPVTKGERVGELVCTLEGAELARVPLTAAASVPADRWEPRNLWDRLWAGLTG